MTENIFDKTLSILNDQSNDPSKWLGLITPLIRGKAIEKPKLIDLGTDAHGRIADNYYFQQDDIFIRLTTGRGLPSDDKVEMLDQSKKRFLTVYRNIGRNSDIVDYYTQENAGSYSEYNGLAKKFNLNS